VPPDVLFRPRKDSVVLKITFINVGYGDAILLESGEGDFRIFIDGGSGEDGEFSSPLDGRIRSSAYLERLGITELDLLVISHFHEDHVCGIEPFVMNGGRVRELWTPWLVPRELRGVCPCPDLLSVSSKKFLSALNSYNRIVERLSRDGCLFKELRSPLYDYPLPGGIKADVLAPSPDIASFFSGALESLYRAEGEDFASRLDSLDRKMNDFSIVLRFVCGNLGILLPGDACPSSEAMGMWDKSRLGAHILKLAHHGQEDSISDDFIRAVAPQIVVTCASSDRRYNSANPLVYEKITRIAAEQGLAPEFIFTGGVPSTPPTPQEPHPHPRPRPALTLVLDGTIKYSL
jgi:competence protein ComEC